MRTPAPKGKTPLIDVQVFLDRPLGEREGYGVVVCREDATTRAALEVALDEAFGKLRTIIMEAVR